MKINFLFLLMFVLLGVTGCAIDTGSEEEQTEISTEPIRGSIGEEDFTVKTVLVEIDELFDDPGYLFNVDGTGQSCPDRSAGFGLFPGDIRFFIETSPPLEVGEYEAKGPYISNASFFGCTVIITSVTDSLISGRVRGGDFDSDLWVEGAFDATFCP